MNEALKLLLVFTAGASVGYIASRLAPRRAQPSQGRRNAAATLLAAERAIEQFRPILAPMAEGRRPSLNNIVQVLR